jgi:hypothetical protein
MYLFYIYREITIRNVTKCTCFLIVSNLVVWTVHYIWVFHSRKLIELARAIISIFSLSHTFSITFKSGDCAGHSRQFIWFSSLQFLTSFARCMGALSSWNKQSCSGKCLPITGHKLSSRISMYLCLFIVPFTVVIVPTP